MDYRIPIMKGYQTIKSAITIQSPRPFIVPKSAARQMMKELANNKSSYDALRGRINAQANDAGLNINMLFSENKPGMFEVEIADKSLKTTRDLADEIISMFTDIENIGMHYKKAKQILVNAKNSEAVGGIKRIFIDPKENYAKKIQGAVLDVIESREFAKIAN